MRRPKTSRQYETIPKSRVKAKKSRYEETFIDTENGIPFESEDITPLYTEEVTPNIPENESTDEKLSNEEPLAINDFNEEYSMDTDDYIMEEEVSIEDIDDSYRPLLDIIEEEVLVNSDVLEKESSDFKGFDGEYGPYFPNFTSAMIFIWITKHMICE
jgi:hypothetical protein